MLKSATPARSERRRGNPAPLTEASWRFRRVLNARRTSATVKSCIALVVVLVFFTVAIAFIFSLTRIRSSLFHRASRLNVHAYKWNTAGRVPRTLSTSWQGIANVVTPYRQ